MDARLVIQASGLHIKIGGALVGVGGVRFGTIDVTCARVGIDPIGAE